jgi:hypothetical protein
MKSEEESDKPALTFWQMVGSVLSSFFGIQNSERRKRDFTHGKAKHFIMIAILMTAVWYGLIYLVVNVVLHK